MTRSSSHGEWRPRISGGYLLWRSPLARRLRLPVQPAAELRTCRMGCRVRRVRRSPPTDCCPTERTASSNVGVLLSLSDGVLGMVGMEQRLREQGADVGVGGLVVHEGAFPAAMRQPRQSQLGQMLADGRGRSANQLGEAVDVGFEISETPAASMGRMSTIRRTRWSKIPWIGKSVTSVRANSLRTVARSSRFFMFALPQRAAGFGRRG